MIEKQFLQLLLAHRLPPKLERTLRRLHESPNGMRPWLDAPKQHNRLLQLGLITEGTELQAPEPSVHVDDAGEWQNDWAPQD